MLHVELICPPYRNTAADQRSNPDLISRCWWVQLISEVVPHSNLVTFFWSCVGNTNAYKYGGSRDRSGQFNGVANINFQEQKVPTFEWDNDLRSQMNEWWGHLRKAHVPQEDQYGAFTCRESRSLGLSRISCDECWNGNRLDHRWAYVFHPLQVHFTWKFKNRK